MIVKKLREEIYSLSQINSLRACWKPGYKNFLGFEEADVLAKTGAEGSLNKVKPHK